MLSASRYLLGVAEIVLLAGAATLGASRLRSRLLPGFGGAPAVLTSAVIAVAILLGAAELLGAAGLFEPLPYLIAVLVLGLGLRLGIAPGSRGDTPPAPSPGRWQTLAGLAVAGVVVAHFCVGVRLRLSTGMTGFDTTWYHAPFAAGFAQGGETFDIHFIAPQFLAWFYPQNSELLHGVGILAFSRDVLSPLLNIAWLGGCLLAAWCAGRPYRAAPITLAGASLALGSGAFADQAGEARNDIVALFFVLAAVAILLNAARARPAATGADGRPARGGAAGGPIAEGALILSGLSIGLAAGTKVNYLAPALALVAAVSLIAPHGARLRALLASGLAALAGCGFWYLRNLFHSGNPLPWVKHLGPLSLPSPEQGIGGREGFGVLHYLTDPGVWGDWFAPGLHQGFGALWPALAAAALAGLVLCLGRRSEPALRASALVGLALVAAWLVAPASASGPQGRPLGFVSGLRYLVPALAVGLALLPLAPRLRSPSARTAVLAAFVLALPFVVATGTPWYSGYRAAALVAGVAAAALAALLVSGWHRAHRRLALALALVAALILVGAGERAQRTYLENRYAEPGFTAPGLDAAFKWARGVSNARIATTGTRQYPLFGTDLSNRVQFVGIHRPRAGFVRPRGCRAWRRALNEGGYDFVVATRDRIEPGRPAFPPEAAWTASDPAASVVLRRPPTTVFRLRGPLDPASCP